MDSRDNARKGSRKALRFAVDASMAVVFVLLMATAIVHEIPHEVLGVALFVLFVAHQGLNWRWYSHLLRGRYTLLRVVQTIVDIALLACIIGLIASSIVLSEHVLSWAPAVPGVAWARPAHMLCSHWAFVLMALHGGTHARIAEETLRNPAFWVGVVAVLAVAAFGALSFLQLDLGSYLLAQVEFAFTDDSMPFWLTTLRYASVAMLCATIGCAAGSVLRNVRIGGKSVE